MKNKLKKLSLSSIDVSKRILVLVYGIVIKYTFSVVATSAIVYVAFFNPQDNYLSALSVVSGFLATFGVLAISAFISNNTEELNTTFASWYLKLVNTVIFCCSIKTIVIGCILTGTALMFTCIVGYVVLKELDGEQ